MMLCFWEGPVHKYLSLKFACSKNKANISPRTKFFKGPKVCLTAFVRTKASIIAVVIVSFTSTLIPLFYANDIRKIIDKSVSSSITNAFLSDQNL